jgi:hypothetical protein
MVDIHVQLEMYRRRGIHDLGYVRSGAYIVDIHAQVEIYSGRENVISYIENLPIFKLM